MADDSYSKEIPSERRTFSMSGRSTGGNGVKQQYRHLKRTDDHMSASSLSTSAAEIAQQPTQQRVNNYANDFPSLVHNNAIYAMNDGRFNVLPPGIASAQGSNSFDIPSNRDSISVGSSVSNEYAHQEVGLSGVVSGDGSLTAQSARHYFHKNPPRQVTDPNVLSTFVANSEEAISRKLLPSHFQNHRPNNEVQQRQQSLLYEMQEHGNEVSPNITDATVNMAVLPLRSVASASSNVNINRPPSLTKVVSSNIGAGSMNSAVSVFSGGTQPKAQSACTSPNTLSECTSNTAQVSVSTSPASRTNPEILKTLLRKKACLYEVDTSKAIALITWLVGRRLAIRFGYFTRQQLQSSVHHVVADKIESGVVTRTKVNRCMQIILNSCFHYIIPRPDGVETGDVFRDHFAASAADDLYLIDSLAAPWSSVDIGIVSEVTDDCDSVSDPTSGSHTIDGSKRTVLLCFNDNIRSFDDVYRSHNEFIRDTANTSNISLTPEEWHMFFNGVPSGISGNSDRQALDMFSLSSGLICGQEVDLEKKGQGVHHHEAESGAFEEMSAVEICRFRTTWCAKRYEHDPRMCAFGHMDVNSGWLRRDPSIYNYSDMTCPKIIRCGEGNVHTCTFNTCPDGVNCPYSHSREESLYHPIRYKKHLCCHEYKNCPLKEVCPHVHDHNDSRQKGRAGTVHAEQLVAVSSRNEDISTPPMLYVHPSPESEFERCMLCLPGLKNLFRRRSEVLFAISQGRM